MFTDAEYRILLSALGREKKICKKVDKELVHEPYEDTLVDICESIERKIHDTQYKYREHDLRKNPNDLPETSKWVMCLCLGNQYLVMRMNPAGDWLTQFSDKFVYRRGFVIAWREIKSFELEGE